jgi:predicted anti-sigma-YlaC factor YlaD
MSEHIHTPQCKVLLGSLSDYIDGELQEELCRQIDEHLKTCEDCRIVVNTLQKTVDIYKQMDSSKDLPEGVKERLLAKLHLEEYSK